jgi:alpha-tubulin suppressor-like RCC1 family protein
VSVLNVSNCVSVSCGGSHTIFLLADGTCKAVGQNTLGQLGDGTTVNKSTPVSVLNGHTFNNITAGKAECFP